MAAPVITPRVVVAAALSDRYEQLRGEAFPMDYDGARLVLNALEREGFTITQTDDGAGASPAASAETRTPSAQADQDGRTPTSSSPQCCGLPLDDQGRCVHRPWHIQKTAAPSSPRTFELVRHHDVSGQTGTGVVAEGVQFTDLTAALRWRGGHPATAVWPNVEEILAVHGHEGATELRWLEQ